MAVLGRVIEEIVLHMAHAAKYPERCRSLLSSIIVGDKGGHMGTSLNYNCDLVALTVIVMIVRK
jgi:hypothetical protein